MKLQLAMIFQEHMVLRRNHIIPVWGRSAGDDTVTINLNGQEKIVFAHNGKWYAEFDPMKETEHTTMTVSSSKTDEVITLNDVAIGEVIFAGGQSNMEFLMKYEYDFEQVKKDEKDHLLRHFTVPQSSFVGFNEKEPNPDWGYWRSYEKDEDKGMFSAVGAFAGKVLREKLNVPVGIISCNWGGTPALAWAAMEDIKDNPTFEKILLWQKDAEEKTNWKSYIESAFKPNPEPSKESLEFMEKFMMGYDFSELLKMGPPPMDTNIFNSYLPGPLSCIRPASLYENMVKQVAPYPVSAFIWWQGEDDDAREWVDCYDESMKAVITSWRKLWQEEIPFFQIELAPFEGKGVTGAKWYDVIRHKQYEATAALDKAYDICILDGGEQFNIHPRHKKFIGERVGKMLLQHVYNVDCNADSPILKTIIKEKGKISLYFENSYGSIKVKDENMKQYMEVYCDGNKTEYQYEIVKDHLVLKGDFDGKVLIKYCEKNYCQAAIFNKEDNPVFGFNVEI